MSTLLKNFENKQLKQLGDLEYHAGDTLKVVIQVEEGSKTRLQTFEGVLIAKRDRGVNSSFVLRKKSYGEGVERKFFVHSPIVKSIEVVKRGKVRQAKLFYIRGLTAKQARIPEKIQLNKKKAAKNSAKAQDSNQE